MSEPLDPLALENLLEQLNDNMGGFNRLLGLRFTHAAPEEIVAQLEVGPQHHQPYGLVHGGVYTTMVETLCSVGAALNALQHGLSAVGLENNTSFLKAVRSGTLTGRATPVVTGKRSQVWSTEIRDEEDRLVATGRVRMLCIEPQPIRSK